MSKSYKLYQVDSFTKEIFKGNPAGVVSNADGLSEEHMQNIARELNNSETAFIINPIDNSHDVWIRFYTPTCEVPICGHATIAAHYVRAMENNLESSTVIHKTGAGVLPVEIVKNQSDYKILMTQGKIKFEEPFEDNMVSKICDALNISKKDLDEKCPIQIVSTGHSKVLIGIKSLEKLNNFLPDVFALTNISKEINCNGFFVFTFDSDENDILTKGRMFAPAIGINEDPVTGNANGPLGAYLVEHKLVNTKTGILKFKSKQGETMNRSGIIEVEVNVKDQLPVKVKIGGTARIVFKTELEL